MSSKSLNSQALMLFGKQLLQNSGANELQAKTVADILVWCDMIGRENQGISRIPIFCNRISSKITNGQCTPHFTQTSPSIELLDGDNGLGHYVAFIAMERAISLAKNTGIGLVMVKHSNFYGAGAYYVNQAAEENMLGFAMSNSFPKVAVHGGIESILGTNPFAFSAPRNNGRNILFDMATSASAGSIIRKNIENKSKIPEGIAIDTKGKPITDPSKVEQGSLLPFGGAKGFGLSLMVEILAGAASGAGISHGVKSMYKDFQHKGNNGHFFLAINIEKLMPINQFHKRLDSLVALIKSSSQINVENKIYYPGEIRWDNFNDSERNGLILDKKTTMNLTALAEKYEVALPW